jgi:hypothetical protein
MKRVSITEIQAWQHCRLKWHYQYERKLRLKVDPEELEDLSYLVSGQAIHFGIEAGILLPVDGFTRQDKAKEAALVYLHNELGEEGARRYIKGVGRAIDGLPQEVWEMAMPQSETKLEVVYSRDGKLYPLAKDQVVADLALKVTEGLITIVGVPDAWYENNGAIYIQEYKSTGSDEQKKFSNYELWSQQIGQYAVLLHDSLVQQYITPPTIMSRHILLSTRGKHVVGIPKPHPKKRLDMERAWMVEAASEVGELPKTPTRGTLCGWCSYGAIDLGLLTGADVDGIIEEKYEVKVRAGG